MGLIYAIIGSGSLGTANAQAHSESKGIDEIVIYSRDEKVKEQINKSHENKTYFPGIPLNSKVSSESLEHSHAVVYRELSKSGVIEIDTVASALSEVAKRIKSDYCDQPVVFTCKSMVNRRGYPMFPHEVLEDILGVGAPLVFLYNAAFARAIIKGDITFNTIASKDISLAREIADLIATDNYRILEETDDVIGLEIIAIMKNVVSIAMGMAERMGVSRSSQSGILYEGRKEAKLLGEKLGANHQTFSGVALEDFWLSGLGKESRNWQFGNELCRDRQRGRFINIKSQISTLIGNLRKRKHRNLLTDIREIYEDILVPGVANGVHDILDSPFIVGRIINAFSRVPYPEASEGTFAIPLLMQRARKEGLTLPLVEELFEVIFKEKTRDLAMKNILNAAR